MNNWVLYMLVTGDFPGSNIAGIEEDAPIVEFIYNLHTLFFA